MDRWRWPLTAALAGATVLAVLVGPAPGYGLGLLLRATVHGERVSGPQEPGTIVTVQIVVPGAGYLLVVDDVGRGIYPQGGGEPSIPAISVDGAREARYTVGRRSATLWAVFCEDPFGSADLQPSTEGVTTPSGCTSAGLSVLSRRE